MANQIDKLNTLALSAIEKVNTLADGNIEKINTLNFSGSAAPSTTTLTNHQFNGTDGVEHTSICYDPDNNFIIVAYRDVDNSNYGTARAASISGSTLTWGSEVVFASATSTNMGICYNTGENRIMIGYSGPSSNTIYVIAGSVGSDKAITFGSAATVDSGGDGGNQSQGYGMIEYNPTYDTATICYENGADSSHNYVAAISLDDVTCTVGTAVEFDDTSEEFWGQSYDPDITKTVIVYDNGTKIGARVMTQSGTGNRTIALGTEALYGNNSGFTAVSEYYGGMPIAYDTDSNRHHCVFYDEVDSAVRMNYFTVSGTTVTWSAASNATSLASGTAAGNETGGGIAYNAARNRLITYGATATSTSSNYNFEYHTISGSTYTSQGSATIIEEGLRNRSQHVPSVQTNSFHANTTILVYADVGGSTGGGRIKLLDAGS